jgi:hypothetical protein
MADARGHQRTSTGDATRERGFAASTVAPLIAHRSRHHYRPTAVRVDVVIRRYPSASS